MINTVYFNRLNTYISVGGSSEGWYVCLKECGCRWKIYILYSFLFFCDTKSLSRFCYHTWWDKNRNHTSEHEGRSTFWINNRLWLQANTYHHFMDDLRDHIDKDSSLCVRCNNLPDRQSWALRTCQSVTEQEEWESNKWSILLYSWHIFPDIDDTFKITLTLLFGPFSELYFKNENGPHLSKISCS